MSLLAIPRNTGVFAGVQLATTHFGHGMRGSEVPASGAYGASPIYNDIVLPAEANDEFIYEVFAVPKVGTVHMDEPGSMTYTSPGDGRHIGLARVRKNGVVLPEDKYGLGVGVSPFILEVGSGGVTIANTVTVIPGEPSSAAGVVTPPVLIGMLVTCFGAGPVKPSNITDTLALIQLALMLRK